MREMDSDGCTGGVCVFHSRFDFADAELCVSLGDMARGTSRSQPREIDAMTGWGPT